MFKGPFFLFPAIWCLGLIVISPAPVFAKTCIEDTGTAPSLATLTSNLYSLHASIVAPIGEGNYFKKYGIGTSIKETSFRTYSRPPQLIEATISNQSSYHEIEFLGIYGQAPTKNVSLVVDYRLFTIQSSQKVDYSFSDFNKDIDYGFDTLKSRLIFSRFLNMPKSEVQAFTPQAQLYSLLYGVNLPEFHGKNIVTESYNIIGGLGLVKHFLEKNLQLELIPLLGYYPKLHKPYIYAEGNLRQSIGDFYLNLQFQYTYNRYVYRDKAYVDDLEMYLSGGAINRILGNDIHNRLIENYEKDELDSLQKISLELSQNKVKQYNFYLKASKATKTKNMSSKPVFTLGVWKRF